MVFTKNAQLGLRSTPRWIIHTRYSQRCRHLSVSAVVCKPKRRPPSSVLANAASLSADLRVRSTESSETSGVVKASASEIERGHRSSKSVLQHLESAVNGEADSRKPKTRRKPKKQQTAAERAAAAEMFSALAGPSSKGADPEPDDSWFTTNWGEDSLKPTSARDSIKRLESSYNAERGRPTPPHHALSGQVLAYHRRIEGLLTSSSKETHKPVLEELVPFTEMKPPAELSLGLDRVLFNPGVHWVQDPRSKVYNFDPYIQRVPQVTDFAFDRITGFVKSSRDEELWDLCKREKKLFGGSTSSTSGMLAHIYFLLSSHRMVDTSCLSAAFSHEARDFSPGSKAAVSTIFNYRDGAYAIDSDGADSDKNILTWLGHVLERFVTYPKDEFKAFLRSEPLPEPDEDQRREAFRYSKSKNFVLRSQLDAHDTRLPGSGVFDVKTRAAAPVRFDMMNVAQASGYLIKTLQGSLESFEKEYYDLIRSAFLKWTFQARIGGMDGMFVAYHNTARMFGFQYIPLSEMDQRIYGHSENGERCFEHCVGMMEEVCRELTLVFPEQSFRATFETPEARSKLSVFVEPVEWDEEAKGERPMRLVEVTAESFLDGRPVDPGRAMGSKLPWTVHWSISHSNMSNNEVRNQFVKVELRRKLGWSLPDNISLGEMKEIWDSLNYGGVPQPGSPGGPVLLNEDGEQVSSGSTFDPDRFRQPSAMVRRLRILAKQGREHTYKDSVERKGQPKIVWGMPEILEFVEEEPGLAEHFVKIQEKLGAAEEEEVDEEEEEEVKEALSEEEGDEVAAEPTEATEEELAAKAESEEPAFKDLVDAAAESGLETFAPSEGEMIEAADDLATEDPSEELEEGVEDLAEADEQAKIAVEDLEGEDGLEAAEVSVAEEDIDELEEDAEEEVDEAPAPEDIEAIAESIEAVEGRPEQTLEEASENEGEKAERP